MGKHSYGIHTKGVSEGRQPFTYQYGHTRNIRLTVKEKGFFLAVERTIEMAAESCLNDALVKDALKKTALIQLIRYGKISLGEICFNSHDVSTVVRTAQQCKETPLLYGLCGNGLIRKMSRGWNDPACLKTVCDSCKSRNTRLDAALYALLIAKSRTYEAEKFTYLWMAMNGLYGKAVKIANEYLPKTRKGKDWITKECDELKFMAMYLGCSWETAPQKDKVESLLRNILIVLTDVRADQIENLIYAAKTEDKSAEEICRINELQNAKGNLIHPYASLLLWVPYKVRCSYFHSEKALPLLSFADEYPLPAIRVLNHVLEDFLDDELWKWFDPEKLEKEIKPQIHAAADKYKAKQQD